MHVLTVAGCSCAAAETEIGRDLDEGLTAQLSKMVPHWKTLDECAATTLAAALDPALDGELGDDRRRRVCCCCPRLT